MIGKPPAPISDETAELLRRYRLSQERRGMLDSSIKQTQIRLRAFARTMEPRSLAEATTPTSRRSWTSARPRNGRKLNPRTRYYWLAQLPRFFKWAVNEGLIETDPTRIDRAPETAPLPAAADHQRGPRAGHPDRAAADAGHAHPGVLCAACGARRSPASDRDDIIEAKGLIRVRNGKGDKERVVPLHPDALARSGASPCPRQVPSSWGDVEGGSPARLSAVIAGYFREHGIDATAHSVRPLVCNRGIRARSRHSRHPRAARALGPGDDGELYRLLARRRRGRGGFAELPSAPRGRCHSLLISPVYEFLQRSLPAVCLVCNVVCGQDLLPFLRDSLSFARVEKLLESGDPRRWRLVRQRGSRHRPAPRDEYASLGLAIKGMPLAKNSTPLPADLARFTARSDIGISAISMPDMSPLVGQEPLVASGRLSTRSGSMPALVANDIGGRAVRIATRVTVSRNVSSAGMSASVRSTSSSALWPTWTSRRSCFSTKSPSQGRSRRTSSGRKARVPANPSTGPSDTSSFGTDAQARESMHVGRMVMGGTDLSPASRRAMYGVEAKTASPVWKERGEPRRIIVPKGPFSSSKGQSSTSSTMTWPWRRALAAVEANSGPSCALHFARTTSTSSTRSPPGRTPTKRPATGSNLGATTSNTS